MYDEISLFDVEKPKYKINKPIKLIELFRGIGRQRQALKRLNANFESWRISEWDYNAVLSYKRIFHGDDTTDYSAGKSKSEIADYLIQKGISSDGKQPMKDSSVHRMPERKLRNIYNAYISTNNVGSIVNCSADELGITDTDKYDHIVCYSFPCQDISLRGNGAGLSKGSGTRSGLLWEVERLLNECTELPRILLLENVPNLIGKKNLPDFKLWCEFLESKGYSNYYQCLNRKDHGLPQNRNRVFMISILGNYSYEFPKPYVLEHRLKDVLEPLCDVPEKYYLSDHMVGEMLKYNERNKAKGNGFSIDFYTRERERAKTVSTNALHPRANYINENDTE